MSDEMQNHVDSALEGVAPSRRNFLRNLLAAGAVAGVLTLPSSMLLAEDAGGDGKGKGKGDGKGDGKGKGKGKGKGDGNGGGGEGKGKGKGKGKGDCPK